MAYCPRGLDDTHGTKCQPSCSSCHSRVCFRVTETGHKPMKRDDFNRLAFAFGVGVKQPSYSSRPIWYNTSVSNGEKIQRRINAIGMCVNNITELKAEEYKQSPEGIAEAERIENERLEKIAKEKARVELIAKNDQIALNLWTRLDNQRIAKEQAEIKRLAQVKEAQRLAAIEAERLRIELLDKQEKQRIQKEQEIKDIATSKEFQRVDKSIPLIASVLPITALGILLLYSRGGKS